jgi:hypothetical protein
VQQRSAVINPAPALRLPASATIGGSSNGARGTAATVVHSATAALIESVCAWNRRAPPARDTPPPNGDTCEHAVTAGACAD